MGGLWDSSKLRKLNKIVDPVLSRSEIPGKPGNIQAAIDYDKWNDPYCREKTSWDILGGGSKLADDPMHRAGGRAVGTIFAAWFGLPYLASSLGSSSSGPGAEAALGTGASESFGLTGMEGGAVGAESASGALGVEGAGVSGMDLAADTGMPWMTEGAPVQGYDPTSGRFYAQEEFYGPKQHTVTSRPMSGYQKAQLGMRGYQMLNPQQQQQQQRQPLPVRGHDAGPSQAARASPYQLPRGIALNPTAEQMMYDPRWRRFYRSY